MAEPLLNCLPAEQMVEQHLPTLQACCEAEGRWNCSWSWQSGWGGQKRGKSQTGTGIPKHVRLFGQHAWQQASLSLRDHSTLCCRCSLAHWQVLGATCCFSQRHIQRLPVPLGESEETFIFTCAKQAGSLLKPLPGASQHRVPACVRQCWQWGYHKQQLVLLTSWLYICLQHCPPTCQGSTEKTISATAVFVASQADFLVRMCNTASWSWEATVSALHTPVLSCSRGSAKTAPGAACPTQHGQGPR